MAGVQPLDVAPAEPDPGPARPPLPTPGPRSPLHRIQAFSTPRVRAALLWLSRQQRLQRMTAEFGPARRMARRFVAGETRQDAEAAVAALARDGLLSTVAFLGEHTTDIAEARAAAAECEGLLRDLAAAGLEPNCSLKLTQLGIQIDPAIAEASLRRIVAAAAEIGGFVRIDMEGSELVDATLDLFERVAVATAGRPHFGVVIQSYLRRGGADVRRLIARGTPVRLVKGAYAEPPTVAYPDKADVDAAYVRLADLLLSPEARAAGVYPAFATHDPAMIAAVRRIALARRLSPDEYEFQMLLGVRRDLQRELAVGGLRVRIYVPYGTHWYPYFMRRLAERPANLLFIFRNLLRR